MRHQSFLTLILFGLIASAIGCSNQPATHEVTGKLEFDDGSPVKFGTIEFLQKEQGVNARGKIERDGSFTLTTFRENDGAIEGTHQVTIQQFATVPLAANQNLQIKHDHGKLVSDSYRSYDRTDLKVTVKPGPNDIKLVVQAMEE